MQTSKSVEKFSKKKAYDPVGDEVRGRKKSNHRTGDSKFRNQFMKLSDSFDKNAFIYE